jgi:hypothetical protein
MKLIRIGMLAALAMAFAGQAMAADPPKIDPKMRAQGMKEAPPVVQKMGLSCAVSDALFVGNGMEKIDGKDVKDSYYEVACTGGLGYFLLARPDGTGQHFDCITMEAMADRSKAAAAAAVKAGGKPAAGSPPVCTLPANANPAQGLQPMLTKASAPCTVSGARVIGSVAAQQVTIYETSCSEGRGFILSVPDAGSTTPLKATDCAESALYGLKCQLTSDDQISKEITDMSKSVNPAACSANAGRWVLTTQQGDRYYEVGCTDGKSGYIFQADATGKPTRVIECGKAQTLGGGCKLTNFDAAQTQEAGLYTNLAKQIGYPCTVTKYNSLGTENAATQREVVELACKEHPGSVWALLPTGSGGAATVYNCLRAQTVSLSCKLSQPNDTYAILGQEITAKGKTCAVTNARVIDGVRSQAGGDFVEVSCSGGGGGMVISYAPAPIEAVSDVFTCKEAAGTTRACKLS